MLIQGPLQADLIMRAILPPFAAFGKAPLVRPRLRRSPDEHMPIA
jgi:hypothetical protein